MAPRAGGRFHLLYTLPIFRRRLTIWPVSLQLPPPQRWALGVSRFGAAMGELNTTFKRMSNTLFKRVVYFFAQALNPARCHTPHRRKKARSGRASVERKFCSYSSPSSASVSCSVLIKRFTSSGGISIQTVETGRPEVALAVCLSPMSGFPFTMLVRTLVN